MAMAMANVIFGGGVDVFPITLPTMSRRGGGDVPSRCLLYEVQHMHALLKAWLDALGAQKSRSLESSLESSDS